MDLKDYVTILIKSLFMTSLFVICMYVISNVMEFNYNFANYISDISGIPSDMAISITSAGFANNITILMTIIESGLFLYFISKIEKTHVYKKVREIIINL